MFMAKYYLLCIRNTYVHWLTFFRAWHWLEFCQNQERPPTHRFKVVQYSCQYDTMLFILYQLTKMLKAMHVTSHPCCSTTVGMPRPSSCPWKTTVLEHQTHPMYNVSSSQRKYIPLCCRCQVNGSRAFTWSSVSVGDYCCVTVRHWKAHIYSLLCQSHIVWRPTWKGLVWLAMAHKSTSNNVRLYAIFFPTNLTPKLSSSLFILFYYLYGFPTTGIHTVISMLGSSGQTTQGREPRSCLGPGGEEEQWTREEKRKEGEREQWMDGGGDLARLHYQCFVCSVGWPTAERSCLRVCLLPDLSAQPVCSPLRWWDPWQMLSR